MEWNKTYGGSDKDLAHSLVQTSDGGYALAGETWYGESDIDFWFVKTDAYGNMQWNETYGQTSDEGANSVIQTSDGGYALAGWYGSETHGTQFRLIKTDSLGNVEWTQTLGDYGYDIANCVIQTSDGGLVVAGATSKFGYYDGYYYPDSWLVKFDLSGNIEWDKTYGYAAPKSEIAHSVVQTSDGGYALVGQEGVSLEYWLVKTDAYGNMQWNKTIESPRSNCEPYSVIQTSDGGYAITGYWLGEYGESWARLVKTDSFGEVEWDWQYTDNYFHYSTATFSVVQTSDGGYALAGTSGYQHYWLIRTDTTGAPIYEGEYGPDYSYANSLVKTSDGGYAMAGCTFSLGAGDADFWLVKTAPETFPTPTPTPVPLANDFFADASVVSSLPFSDSGSTLDATTESGEPQPCWGIGSTVWYRFTPASDVAVQAQTAGSDFDTVLAVYTGASLATLSLVGCDDDGGPDLTSVLTFQAQAGVTYYIQAGGYPGEKGSLVLSIDIEEEFPTSTPTPTPTPTPTLTPTPGAGPVGGIPELPDITGPEAAMNETASANYTLWTVIAAATAAGVITLAGAAWYARRRWLR